MVAIRHIFTIPLALWSFVLTFYTIGKLMLFLSTPLKIQREHVWILNLLDNFSHFELTIYPITIDTILIILFILQHSLMKSEFIKSIWNLFGLKSAERCIYNLMTSFTLLVCCLYCVILCIFICVYKIRTCLYLYTYIYIINEVRK